MKQLKLVLKRIVESQGEVLDELRTPGDAVIVKRGVPRWMYLNCPCGCNENIPVNLDSRSGKAWRLYEGPKSEISLYPSVWRDTGCESHFIIWRSRIFLFGRSSEAWESQSAKEEMKNLAESVRRILSVRGVVNYVNISDELGAIPWDVLDACRYLVKNGVARENDTQGSFSLK